MAQRLLLDTGFWFALYDSGDTYHRQALEVADFLDVHGLVVPWPTLYETLNTRLARRRTAMQRFAHLLAGPNVHLLPDEDYRDAALEAVCSPSGPHRALSLVDAVLRLVVADTNVQIDALITFNPGDFSDVCQKAGVEVFP
ncbi:type II toxin-antitoxin system VapC family toxin [Desulfovermiculus halophilus]|uniref:type II toxin-antitoxin system VapC family toxin n=1 Tax=Desulfovermiculus halophilus TaxID=339722 RepID=UPI00048A3FDF|nr:PIN domain-containing protein [Desulfovermiculus halophilus]